MNKQSNSFEKYYLRTSIDTLKEGDLYVMGEKAVGTDWLQLLLGAMRPNASIRRNLCTVNRFLH